MNPNPFAPDSASNAASGAAEETLRLIASLPAPQGLEDRIHAGLRAAQRAQPQAARLLAWPAALRPGRTWVHGAALRTAAAAAIACVVAGGGWSVYSRVQPHQPSSAAALPAHPAASSGFSSAGAMRVPQTLNGPVLTHPLIAAQTPAKAPVRAARKPLHREQSTAAGKAAVQAATDK
jgi:hypothetical protein